MKSDSVRVPSLVRIKPGVVGRLGEYCQRQHLHRPALILSADLPRQLQEAVAVSLRQGSVQVVLRQEAVSASFDEVRGLLSLLPTDTDVVIGFGGGKALDVAKLVASLARKPYLAVPTSLSNDSFASPGVSLLLDGRKRSLSATIPSGVLIDTQVCLGAPKQLWHSGVGDLAAKLTAVRDWKLAFHATGEAVNDFAALLSDATVFQFLSRPIHDLQGMRLLGTALMQSGIAMEICGSSRPASGSEHLISHALDQLLPEPGLHGIQVGLATYIVSALQASEHHEAIGALFDETDFWHSASRPQHSADVWLEAVKLAPSLKSGFHTILSERDWTSEVQSLIRTDRRLRHCFA